MTGLVPALKAVGARVVCRSHVGSEPGDPLADAARDFLRAYVASADAIVFTRSADRLPRLGAARVAIIQPCIDPCSPKNRFISRSDARALLVGAGLAGADRAASAAGIGAIRRTGRAPRLGADRLVVHLARWDRLKDPLGIMRAFLAAGLDAADARLILAGPATDAVADDPEASAVYREVERVWQRLPGAERDRIDLVRLSSRDQRANAVLVNALQRESTVIVKKSLRRASAWA